MSKVFTLDEVSEHHTNKDCWLLIDGKLESYHGHIYHDDPIKMGKVYDVTKFLKEHPGGDEVLVAAIGRDATDDFKDVGHSATAKEMLDEFYVGDIDFSTIIKPKTKYTPLKQPLSTQDDKPSEYNTVKILKFLVPFIILSIGVGISFYTKWSA